ncbi:hypothetical protein CEQ90_00140 [Lewinellaceae bacterium SD302]|nr:hypothetical protein CEQ90_00140 [Lewinellaceae bacterium SD302]
MAIYPINPAIMFKAYYLFISLAMVLFFGNPLSAATITVNNTADAGAGTLRQAVMDAMPGDTILFDASTNLSIISLASQIDVSDDLTIIGNGELMTVLNGGGATRLFNVTDGAVSISGMGIGGGSATSGGAIFVGSDADLTVSNIAFGANFASGATATEGGGAIANDGGSVSVMSCVFTNNAANGASGSGGAILNLNSGTLSVTDSDFSDNSSSRAGGAIEDNSTNASSVVISNCDFTNNITGPAPGNGGAIHITGNGGMSITGGTYSGNVAAREGGAIWNGSGVMGIESVTIDDNEANGPASDDGGGGIFNNGGTCMIFGETTITNNRALGTSGSGGGILNATGSTMTISNAVLQGNSSSRAGGAIEDQSGAGTTLALSNVDLMTNTTGPSPGNGGGLHVTGPGDVSYVGGMVSGNTAATEGGGLWNHTGTMNLEDLSIINNEAQGPDANHGGGGLFNLAGGTMTLSGDMQLIGNSATGTSGSGGGILNSLDASLTIEGATFQSNTANRAGGAIEDISNDDDVLVINNTDFLNNEAGSNPGNGGALHITGSGRVEITGGSAQANVAAREGGAFWNGFGRMILSGVNIIDNIAQGDAPDDGGGGIFNNGGFVVMNGLCTVSGNMATGTAGSGGGIFNGPRSSLAINFCRILNNTANRAGGGIEDQSGPPAISITNSSFSNNNAGVSPGNGGGIHLTGNGNISLSNVSFTNNQAVEGGGLWVGTGRAILTRTFWFENVATGDESDQGGGAVFVLPGGELMVRRNSAFVGNMATGASGSGGAILATDSTTLTVMQSQFMQNTASRAGGAIEDQSGGRAVTEIVDVEFTENTTGAAPGNGGAIHITGAGSMNITGGKAAFNVAAREGGAFWNGAGTMMIDNVNIHDNVANGTSTDDGGGGVFNNGGVVRIENSTIWNNSAPEGAGAGGGIFNLDDGNLFIVSSTISGNSANAGGGIFNGDTTVVTNSTIAFNEAVEIGGGIFAADDALSCLGGTIAAANTASSNADVAGGDFTTNTYNLIGTGSGIFPMGGTGDIVGTDGTPVDAFLDTLADNGGDQLTIALFCESPAIDAGNPGDDTEDQRGLSVANGTRDIGAFESQDGECEDRDLGGDLRPIAQGNTPNDGQTSIATNEVQSAKIFPNPSFSQAVNLVLPYRTDANATTEVQLFDLSGKMHFRNVFGSGQHRLELGDLPTGTYLLRLITNGETESHRLLLK